MAQLAKCLVKKHKDLRLVTQPQGNSSQTVQAARASDPSVGKTKMGDSMGTDGHSVRDPVSKFNVESYWGEPLTPASGLYAHVQT